MANILHRYKLPHMSKQVLFIHGGGDNGYETDRTLMISLQTALGKDYAISYPELQSDGSASDFGWPQQIGKNISSMGNAVSIVAHSLGASMLLRYLSEHTVNTKIEGIFLLATPFWSGNEEWKAGLKLREDFAEKLPENMPAFFYHCHDDEEVSLSHLAVYKKKLKQATFCELPHGGHRFVNGVEVLAKDIQSLRNNA